MELDGELVEHKIFGIGQIVEYANNYITVLFDGSTKPWEIDKRWVSEHQIQISPILELKDSIDFKVLVPNLQLFKGLIRWSGAIQGTNAVREINKTDFKIIEDSVYKASINTK